MNKKEFFKEAAKLGFHLEKSKVRISWYHTKTIWKLVYMKGFDRYWITYDLAKAIGFDHTLEAMKNQLISVGAYNGN